MVKAELRQSDTVGSSDHVGPIARAAVIKHYGSVKEAAYALGEGAGQPRLDPSLMVREFDAGKLGRLDYADDAAKAAVARALADHYEPAATTASRTRYAARSLRATADELDAIARAMGD